MGEPPLAVERGFESGEGGRGSPLDPRSTDLSATMMCVLTLALFVMRGTSDGSCSGEPGAGAGTRGAVLRGVSGGRVSRHTAVFPGLASRSGDTVVE